MGEKDEFGWEFRECTVPGSDRRWRLWWGAAGAPETWAAWGRPVRWSERGACVATFRTAKGLWGDSERTTG